MCVLFSLTARYSYLNVFMCTIFFHPSYFRKRPFKKLFIVYIVCRKNFYSVICAFSDVAMRCFVLIFTAPCSLLYRFLVFFRRKRRQARTGGGVGGWGVRYTDLQ